MAAATILGRPGAPLGLHQRFHDGPGVPAHQVRAQTIIRQQARQAQRQPQAKRQQRKGRQHAPADAAALSHAASSGAALRR